VARRAWVLRRLPRREKKVVMAVVLLVSVGGFRLENDFRILNDISDEVQFSVFAMSSDIG
jgi:hypothetical protein